MFMNMNVCGHQTEVSLVVSPYFTIALYDILCLFPSFVNEHKARLELQTLQETNLISMS